MFSKNANTFKLIKSIEDKYNPDKKESSLVLADGKEAMEMKSKFANNKGKIS